MTKVSKAQRLLPHRLPSLLLHCLLLTGLTALTGSAAMASDTAILQASMTADDLTVTVAWDTFITPDWVELALLDAHQYAVASRLIWATPGASTPTAFDDFAHSLVDTGFQFSVVMRDSTGRHLAEPYPFRLTFDCSGPDGPCELQTVPGIESSIPSTRDSLVEALDGADADSSDILRDVLMTRPELSGPVIALAAQLEVLNKEHPLGNDCFCTWLHSSSDYPQDPSFSKSGPGRSRDGSGWAQAERKDKRGRAKVAGQISSLPGQLQSTVSATSRHTMSLQCWQISQWSDYRAPMGQGLSSRAIQWPQLESCSNDCLGDVKTSASIGHYLNVDIREASIDSLPTAVASATASGALTIVPLSQPLSDDLQWQAETECRVGPCSSVAGVALLPSLGSALTRDTRSVTGILSGRATLTLQAEEPGQWSFAQSCFRPLELKMVGSASCTIEPTAQVVVVYGAFQDPDIGGDCGELEIDPWGN